MVNKHSPFGGFHFKIQINTNCSALFKKIIVQSFFTLVILSILGICGDDSAAPCRKVNSHKWVFLVDYVYFAPEVSRRSIQYISPYWITFALLLALHLWNILVETSFVLIRYCSVVWREEFQVGMEKGKLESHLTNVLIHLAVIWRDVMGSKLTSIEQAWLSSAFDPH